MLNSTPAARASAGSAGDLAHVGGRDVPRVGARMHGDPGRAGVRRRRCTASSTDGTLPPRELRTVATLLTLTESLTNPSSMQLQDVLERWELAF